MYKYACIAIGHNFVGDSMNTIMLTGKAESGKSKTCEFFLPHISSSRAPMQLWVGKVGGKMLKFLDCPGILDPSTCTMHYIFEKLATAILCAPNGIHALGFVINVTCRMTVEDGKMLTQLLELVEIIPYSFIVFSHAKRLAETDNEQKRIIKEMLSNVECPTVLSNVLKKVNHRYIVLESVESMDENYHRIKAYELAQIVETIFRDTRKPLTCFTTDVAKKLQESNINLKRGIIAVEHDLKMLLSHLQEKKQKEGELQKENEIPAQYFWENFSVWVANCMGGHMEAPHTVSLNLATLGDSALAALVTDVSTVDDIVGDDKLVGNKMCIIQ